MMRLVAVLSAAAAVLVSCPSAGSRTAPPSEAILALRQLPDTSTVLARLDPVSLKPVSPQVEVGEYHRAWSVSPDGSRLALGISGPCEAPCPGGRLGIMVVDLAAMTVVRKISTGIAAVAVAWLAPRVLVASLQRGGTVVVDPETGKILRRRRGFSWPDATVRIADRIVMLFPPLRYTGSGIPLTRVAGTARLAVLDATGRFRSVTLTRVRLRAREMHYVDRAGLTVDPEGRRAHVFAAGAPVAAVDLRTMRVSYHRLALPRKKRVLASWRRAIWLGGGRALVVGRDVVRTRSDPVTSVAAGAVLVDTGTGGGRVIDSTAGDAAFVAGRVLVYGSYGSPGVGLRSYTVGGRRLYHLFRGQQVLRVEAAGGTAYVRVPRRVYVVDVPRGKVLNEIRPPVELVDVVVPRS